MRRLIATATVSIALTACSSSTSDSEAAHAGTDALSTSRGTTLTITPDRMLAATNGVTPVAFAKPAHGRITYGPNGTMIYTPDAGFAGTDELTVTVCRAVKLYAEDQLPLATVGGVAIQASAHGSGIAAVPGSADEIYGLTDRGPNVDGRIPNEKVLPVPDFHPYIAKLKLAEGVATVERTITLHGSDGSPLVGLVDRQANTGEALVDLNGAPLLPSDYGVDTEGLVATRDGNFWVSDEYGPNVIHFDANGKELERLSPFDGTLPRELSLRSSNRGMEGLTITPDGTTLAGIMQSALQTPGLQGAAKSVPVARIVTINLVDPAIVHEYLYPLANPQETNVAVSEITALSATTFLVAERDNKPAPSGNKKIYAVDIAGATDVGPRSTVPGASYQADGGGLVINGVPIETAVGVTTDAEAVAKLSAVGITVAAKTLKLDLGALVRTFSVNGDFFGHDKIEGLITPDGGKTLIIANDSDFGLAGLASANPPMRLKPKILPNGTQDNGEFLAVDTTMLPPKTEAVMVAIKVG
ncbi:esterase-like activity of phytase family protein [Mycobacterium simiae]|uniref:Esterase-like activity of phytase family protein n=1 Tax=Mycobacterium simiae TaxID=1784 RepID=A0A5B1BJF1_MYCSI|nr:esterase-like activity of phytase family protein [Mycobacterium simiae]